GEKVAAQLQDHHPGGDHEEPGEPGAPAPDPPEGDEVLDRLLTGREAGADQQADECQGDLHRARDRHASSFSWGDRAAGALDRRGSSAGPVGYSTHCTSVLVGAARSAHRTPCRCPAPPPCPDTRRCPRPGGRGHRVHGVNRCGALLRAGSALGVLRRLAGLLEAGLLALDDAVVTTEEAGLLEGRSVVLLVDLVQRAGHTEAHGPGLTGCTAAGEADDDVEAALEVESRERIVDLLLVQLVREVVLERAAVDRPLAGSGDQADAGDGALAAAGAVARGGHGLPGADDGLAGRLGGVALGRGLVGHGLEGLGGGLSHGSPWFFRVAGR